MVFSLFNLPLVRNSKIIQRERERERERERAKPKAGDAGVDIGGVVRKWGDGEVS
jgi:hypothetical protein